jgi:hypothetical protein
MQADRPWILRVSRRLHRCQGSLDIAMTAEAKSFAIGETLRRRASIPILVTNRIIRHNGADRIAGSGRAMGAAPPTA